MASLRRLTGPALLSAVIIAFFWKLAFTNQYTWLASPDLWQIEMPWQQFQTHEWHNGRFPLWDPHGWAGFPFLAQSQPGAAYPLNWILFLMPFQRGFLWKAALDWYYVLTRVLAGLTFYWLCRDLGRSRRASIIGAATYGIAGYLGSVEWPEMVNGAVWAPLVFLFQMRSARGVRPVASAVLSGFFLGVAWLCGHHQLPIYVTLASGFLWLYLALREGRPDWRIVRCAAAAMVIAVMVSAVQTLPTAEYGRLARRWASTAEPLRWNDKVPYPVHGNYSITPLSLWGIVVPGADYSVSPFIGIGGLTLALIAVRRRWADARVRWFAAMAGGALLFALGPSSVFHGMFYALVPMVEKARVPAQALLIFHIAACALIAFGLDALPEFEPRAARRAALLLFSLGAVVALGGLYAFESRAIPINGDTRFMVTAMAAIAAGALILASTRSAISGTTAAALFLAVVLWECGNQTGYTWAHVDNKERMAGLHQLQEDADIRLYLAAQRGRPRIAYDQEVIPQNLGHWWDIESFSVYVASAPDLLLRREPFHPRTRALLGIRYYIGTKPLSSDLKEVFQGASGRKIYEFPEWMPRVWSVHQAAQVSDAAATQLLIDGSVDLRTRTFSTAPPPTLEQCAGADDVQMREHLPNTVRIEATMACRGLVILDDQYFPGWQARVDGRPAPIIDAYGLVRGVPVEGGRHEVEFVFRPMSVFAGLTLTVIGTLIVLAAVLWPRFRRT